MTAPFTKFEVTPTYGSFRAVIAFDTAIAGSVYIYRSLNGLDGWELLNPDTPVVAAVGGSYSFADVDLKTKFAQEPFYKAAVDPVGGGPDTWIHGPAIAPYSFLGTDAKRRVNACVKREVRGMSGRKTDGTPVFHIIPRDSGNFIHTYDSETDQILGPSCPDTPEDGFGMIFEGGVYKTFQTWARMLKTDPIFEEAKEAGNQPESTSAEEGSNVHSVLFRLLAYPRPAVGHIIVLPNSDMRFALTNPITPFYFPETNVPIAWEVKGVRLELKDPRYRILLPVLGPAIGVSRVVTSDDGVELIGEAGGFVEG